MAKGFSLTEHAKEDLFSIWEYTLQHWDENQADAYITALYNAFELLVDHPDIGKNRDEIAPGYQSFAHDSHIIFFINDEVHIQIIGVPHQRLDTAAFFKSR